MNKKHNRFRASMSREQFDQLRGTEIKSKRTRFGKVFSLGANRFQAVTYTDPVHRFNEKTHEWDELDNRFAATPRMKAAKAAWKQGIMPAVAHGDVLLECKSGAMDVACAMSGEIPFINLTDAEGRKLAWGIEGAMSILPEADEINDVPAESICGMREKVLERLHGEVSYNGIFAGVDLHCKLDRGFKDELVFAEKESVRPVTFLLESEGRQMELTEQKMLIVKDAQGKAVFRLQAPFMVDAEDQRGDVAVQLEARENGMYAMTYIPDAAFMETAAYPVVLDPEIQTEQGGVSIVDTYVREGYNADYSENDRIWITANTYYGKRHSYLRVKDLPPIASNHFITGAYLYLRNYAQPTADAPVMCSEVLGHWEPNKITFATQPSVQTYYQDYCIFPAQKTTWQSLDVTSLARKWYLGENYGVMLSPYPTNYEAIQLQSSNGGSKPYFVVNYASLAGLEGYLSYDGQSAGLAGSGSVSLANGNLIFAHHDTAMNGNRMPVSITHYYNSCDANVDEFGLGYGWRTSVHQTLHKEYINDEVVYVYTDGDGTEHWFELDEDADETQYVDMSGLSLTLTVGDDGKITITDKGDDRMVFPAITANPTADAPSTGKCLIEHLYDAVGNMVTVTARTDNPLFVASVEDGAGRTTTFVYATQSDGSMKCTAIQTPWQTDPAACTRFAYTNGCLTEIIYEDNRVSSYHYATRNGYHLLDQAQGADGLAVRYEYSNTGAIYGLPHCITCAESGETAILSKDEAVRSAALFAAKITYEYGNHLTLVTDNISGKTLRYHFNDNGNEISIDDGLGYAVYTEYDQRDENAIAPINHATTHSRMQRVVKNLLMDHSFEGTGSAWVKTGNATFLRNTSVYYQGLVSQKIDLNSGEAVVQQTVSLKPGNSYTFSGYGKSAAPNAVLRVTYTIDGNEKMVASKPFPILEDAANADFVRQAFSFYLPEDAEDDVVCAMVANGAAGACWFDCLQLEEGLTCNHYNMLQNGDFSVLNSQGTTPSGWNVDYNNTSYVSWEDLAVSEDGGSEPPEHLKTSGAVRLKGLYSREVAIYQDIRLPGNAGDRFTLGGWCKTYAKKNDFDTNTYCRIKVEFSAGDPSNANATLVFGGAVYYNAGEEDWQFGSAGITAPHNYSHIRITIQMLRQMNYAYFTNLYLYPEAFGTDYVYDAKGNRKKAIELYNGVRQAEYDDHDNMIRYTAPGHTLSSTFGYGEGEAEQKKHLLRTFHSPMGTDGQFGYDAHGNAKRADTSGSAGSVTAITRSTAKFQHNDNYVHQQTDARGKSVTTAVDANKGITTRVTDPKGQAVEYTHDNLRRVTEVKTVIPGTTENAEYHNEYAYDPARGLLTSVKHNVDNDAAHDVVYRFEYDALGRRTKVLVGDNLLSENVYQNDPAEAHYGTLTQMKYGNDTVVRNVYDDFNRITGVKYGDESSPRYEYAYNANGQAAYVKNNLLQQVAESEYDFSNRPSRVKTHKFNVNADGILSNTEHIYTGEVAYDDAFGRLSKFTEKVGDGYATYATQFGYDDENRPTSLDYGDHGESTVEYDGLGRVAKTTVKAGSGTANETVYTYVAGAALETKAPAGADAERKEAAENAAGKTSTTGLVETMTQTGGSFTYEYDDNGNITRVVQDGVETAYTYDALGQLTQVDDGHEGATWEYTYDQGGNIKSKKKVVNGVETESMTFEYTNANWRDQLTKVNGTTITYDKIGNPLNDGTWQYTWQNGRQLKSMSKSGTFAKFVYNENGLRVQKIIQPSETDTTNAVVTKYTLHGKNVVHMTQGSNELHFFYDAQNKPAVVVYNGTPYTYVKNLQGDIVAILDSNGIAVVQYRYDAWGRQISCDVAAGNSNAAALSTLNPFRYRGYVYDEETGLYYVSSRFYNWTAGRWINSDDIAYLGADGTVLSNMLYAYCANSPVNKIDFDGNLGLAIGLFIGASALIGGLAGALTAACTGGNVLEGALEGAALGAVAATATIVAPIIVTAVVPATFSTATVTMIATGATFVASGLGGMGVDYATQRFSHAFSENSDEDFQLDTGRMLKTGFTNGIAGVIPTFGAPNESVVNAVGSLAMGFDASFINAVIEIVTVRSLE